MKIWIVGRLAAVVTLGVFMLGTPLTAAAAEPSPTSGSVGSTATSGELTCDCPTEPAAAGDAPPPDAEPPAPGSSAPEEPAAADPATPGSAPEKPAAAPPAPPASDSPAPAEPLVDLAVGDPGAVDEPAEAPTDEVPSGSELPVDTGVQPTIDLPADATPMPTPPPEPGAASAPSVASEVSPASTSVTEAGSAAPQQAPVREEMPGSMPAPFQGGSGTANAPPAAAQTVGQAATPGALPSAEGTGAAAESTAPDARDPSEERARAGARHRTAGPSAFESSSGVEQTVTAGIAIIAPRGITSTVSVAVEFGRAGHGWAGAIVFNVWLRRQMRERRMSQRQLAHRSGVDHSTISRLVSGERVPSLATATRLVRALGRVNGDGDAFAYFAHLPEETVFPTTRVEMALRGDDEINDDDVRSLMSAYLDARTRRRRARQLTDMDNGPSVRSPGAVDQTDTRSPPRRVLRGPKDASA